MSSPFRALSPKRDGMFNSRSSSPSKSKLSTPAKTQAHSLRKLPRLGVDLTPRKTQPQSQTQTPARFSIYRDEPEEYPLDHKSRDAPSANNDSLLNDNKENILKPKIMALEQAGHVPRRPLANLDIRKFPGHVMASGQILCFPIELTHMYQPKNYENEVKSAHSFCGLPSFVTPPRNSMKKILHRSGNPSEFGTENDELERRLTAKLQQPVARRRAMSVGTNKGKALLVQKTQFEISTN